MSQPLKYAAIAAGALGVGIVGFAAYFTLLFVGAFAPPLPPMPDWRTPYERALAAGDCKKASRILHVAFANLIDEAGLEGADLFESGRCSIGDLDAGFRYQFETAAARGEDLREPFHPLPDARPANGIFAPSLRRLNGRSLGEFMGYGLDELDFAAHGFLAARLLWLRLHCINPYQHTNYNERIRLAAEIDMLDGNEPGPLVARRFQKCGDKIAPIVRILKNRARTDEDRILALVILSQYLKTESPKIHYLRAQWIIRGLAGDPEYELAGLPEDFPDRRAAMSSLFRSARTGYAPAVTDLIDAVGRFSPDDAEAYSMDVCWTIEDVNRVVQNERRAELAGAVSELEAWLGSIWSVDQAASCRKSESS